MSTEQTNNKENTSESKEKGKEQTKDWTEHFNDLIKNPLSTFVLGGASGYLISQSIANHKLKAEKEEHQKQLKEKDDLINKLIENTQKISQQIESTLKGIIKSEDENTIDLEEDLEDKVYRPRKKIFRLK